MLAPARLYAALTVALAGAAPIVSAAPSSAQEPAPEPQPRVVVAVIESAGVNPYHEFFNAGGPCTGTARPRA